MNESIYRHKYHPCLTKICLQGKNNWHAISTTFAFFVVVVVFAEVDKPINFRCISDFILFLFRHYNIVISCSINEEEHLFLQLKHRKGFNKGMKGDYDFYIHFLKGSRHSSHHKLLCFAMSLIR